MIAICGMGMGSLAGLLKEKGFEVSGSDQKVYPPMSRQLQNLGIPIKEGFDAANLGSKPDLVIVGNAVSKDNPEVEALLKSGIPYLSMPEALKRFFLKGRRSIVVAGTHGKTTTSALAAWLLHETKRSPGFLVGGILKNLDRSYQTGNGKHFVVEGDEYDCAFFDKGPKFLHYHPDILVLNPIEFDHADIYRDLPHLLSSFEKLVTTMPSSGLVIAHFRNQNVRSLFPKIPCRLLTFGIEPEADLHVREVTYKPSLTEFEVFHKNELLGKIESPMIGRHNIENLLAVITVLLEEGVSFREIQEAIRNFQGVKRRQELIGRFRGITLIDDFAHHPTAIHETLAAIRSANPGTTIWAVFEPRSNTTRRRVFQKEFPAAFENADHVLIAPVYQPEKIPPSERLDPRLVIEELRRMGKNASCCESIEEIVERLASETKKGEIVCLMSNGSFGNLAEKLPEQWGGRG